MTDTEFDKLRDDVYAEIGLAAGWDDSDDDTVDIKGRITDAVMRYLGRDLLAAEAKVRAVEADPTAAMEWTVRTYTLADTPDSSIPILTVDDDDRD